MAKLLSPTTSAYAFLPSLSIFRNIGTTTFDQRKCGPHARFQPCAQLSSEPISHTGFGRRDLMLLGFSSSVSLLCPSQGCLSLEDLKMASLVDYINAYSYVYPVELSSKNLKLRWVESRKPERYSSAAPLSPDARLRIVSERVDMINNVIISVSIGPPNLQFLKSKDKSAWSAKDVADSVLSDKSGLRITPSQRMAESSVINANSRKIDGEPYWYYEYLIRKSPTSSNDGQNLYRHYIGSTAERDGYLYSLNASTLSKQWKEMGAVLEKTTSSFRLLPPT